MAKVLLATSHAETPGMNRFVFGPIDLFRRSATTPGLAHGVVEDPVLADLILFCDAGPEPFFRSIFSSPLFRDHARKVFVFDPSDHPLPLLPGVYASIEKQWYDADWIRSGFYAHASEQDRFQLQAFPREVRYLASFAGSCSNALVRQALLQIRRTDFLLRDTSGKVIPAFTKGDEGAIRALTEDYVGTVRESAFVLCPRGEGASSMRLFEVMRMGRCPVILADDWVPPKGPDWEKFSLRVPEANVLRLPELLLAHKPQADAMGALARTEWERWFSTEALFRTVVDWCLELRPGGRWMRASKRLHFLRPFHMRHYLRTLRQKRGGLG